MMRHIKVVISLDLAQYSTESILKMYGLKILTRDEVEAEFKARDMDDYTILMTLRGFEGVKKAG